jgi:hypothetical protein
MNSIDQIHQGPAILTSNFGDFQVKFDQLILGLLNYFTAKMGGSASIYRVKPKPQLIRQFNLDDITLMKELGVYDDHLAFLLQSNEKFKQIDTQIRSDQLPVSN